MGILENEEEIQHIKAYKKSNSLWKVVEQTFRGDIRTQKSCPDCVLTVFCILYFKDVFFL